MFLCRCCFCDCSFLCASVCLCVYVPWYWWGLGKLGWRVMGGHLICVFVPLSVWVFVWLFLFCVLCVYVLIKVVVEKKWVEEWGEAIAFVYFCACECLFVWLFLFIFYQRMCALRKSGLKSEESYLISVFVHVGLFVICLPTYVRDDKSGGWEKVGWRVRRGYLWQGGAEISRAVRSRARGGAKHPSADEKDKWQRRWYKLQRITNTKEEKTWLAFRRIENIFFIFVWFS